MFDALDSRALLDPFVEESIIEPLNEIREVFANHSFFWNKSLHVLVQTDRDLIDGNRNRVLKDARAHHHQSCTYRNAAASAAGQSGLSNVVLRLTDAEYLHVLG